MFIEFQEIYVHISKDVNFMSHLGLIVLIITFSWLRTCYCSKLQVGCLQIQPIIACVASVSVRFTRKERGTRVKDREKSDASKALVSFLERSKPKVPFFGISLLRNQTEALATQAKPIMIFFIPSTASISAQQDSTSAISHSMSGLGTALRLLATYKKQLHLRLLASPGEKNYSL